MHATFDDGKWKCTSVAFTWTELTGFDHATPQEMACIAKSPGLDLDLDFCISIIKKFSKDKCETVAVDKESYEQFVSNQGAGGD
jgi:hypothetical protein